MRAAARAFLLVVAAGVLFFVALALFLIPARNMLVKVFALPMAEETGTFGLPADEPRLRLTLRPLLVAGVAFAVATLAALVR